MESLALTARERRLILEDLRWDAEKKYQRTLVNFKRADERAQHGSSLFQAFWDRRASKLMVQVERRRKFAENARTFLADAVAKDEV